MIEKSENSKLINLRKAEASLTRLKGVVNYGKTSYGRTIKNVGRNDCTS